MSSFENRDGIIPLSVFPALRKKLEILQISELGLFKTNIRRTKLRQSGQQRLMFESGSIFAHLLKPSDRLPKISTYRTIEFTSVRFGQIIQRNFYFQRFETPHPATVILYFAVDLKLDGLHFRQIQPNTLIFKNTNHQYGLQLRTDITDLAIFGKTDEDGSPAIFRDTIFAANNLHVDFHCLKLFAECRTLDRFTSFVVKHSVKQKSRKCPFRQDNSRSLGMGTKQRRPIIT